VTALTYGCVPNDVSRDASLSQSARLLYVILLGLPARGDGYVSATHETLAGYLGVSGRQVRSLVHELASAGRIRWERGGRGRPNRYLLHDVVPRSRPFGAARVEAGAGGREAVGVAAPHAAEDVGVAAELVGAAQPSAEAPDHPGVPAAHVGIGEPASGTVGAPESSTGARAGHVGIFPPTAARAALETTP
jgi:hypothetical protein